MKTNKRRRFILFFMFLLFPITIFYFSPIYSIWDAILGGISGSVIVFGALFIASIFVGRAPCGWIMPCGGLQESCFYINNKRVLKNKKDSLKFLIWIPWFSSIVIAMIINFSKLHFDPFFNIEHGISISKAPLFIIYYSVIIIFVLLSMLSGKRASCHYICWIAPFMILGRKLGNQLKAPRLELQSDKSKCTNCGSCTNACPMSLEVQNMVNQDKMEHSECIYCNECVSVCKSKVLKIRFTR